MRSRRYNSIIRMAQDKIALEIENELLKDALEEIKLIGEDYNENMTYSELVTCMHDCLKIACHTLKKVEP